VYIPIQKILKADDFTNKELDAMQRDDAWSMYQEKSSEIEKAGDRPLNRFATKKGQSKMLPISPDSTKRKKQLLGSTKVLRHGDGDKPLSVIKQPNAALYVHCHGNSQVVGLRPLKLKPDTVQNSSELLSI
jgi:hypothetical protein